MARIILENRAKIDIDIGYLEEVRSYANLPDGSILLVLHDGLLPKNDQGVCIVSQLKHLDPGSSAICRCSSSTEWDCCVAIAKKWCTSRNQFPAYFTYLLGHEFGHAYVCLSDICLHIHCCLIVDRIIPASYCEIQFPHEFPNEQLFDQFGKYLALKLHGDTKFVHEINSLKKTANGIEKQRLELIEKLPPKSDFSDLRKTMIDFSKPYKDNLIISWKRDRDKKGPKSLASWISDYDKLFEY